MRGGQQRNNARPVLIFWIIAGWAGFVLLPWYGVDGFWNFEWLTDGYPWDSDYPPDRKSVV